jgi:hypothetical protein
MAVLLEEKRTGRVLKNSEWKAFCFATPLSNGERPFRHSSFWREFGNLEKVYEHDTGCR